MGDLLTQWLSNLTDTHKNLLHTVDFISVLMLTYMVLMIIGERRTLWMVRGFIILMLATAISSVVNLTLLSFVLNKLVIGSAVAMAVILQSEFRRLLEQLGQGQVIGLFLPPSEPPPKAESVIDEIVDAVKDLSQNRTGALLILETTGPIDERDFSVPGVRLNAEVSKELLQTIFQTSTLLHDGAVWIRMSRIIAAGVILPLSDRTASRKLGTRHRAAMGITDRVENCLCVVVSEETGSISLAEKGLLNRPLTSSKLKELLEAKFSQSVEREAVAPDLRNLGRQLNTQGAAMVARLLRLPSSDSQKKK
ncbi:diadenylate cyclase CdaA [Roseofilum reptotaenium CS-1145]|uniref:Diadenylate cyclase n=1 Tax=Roseofilum reptotaenium AO1-A TaxID=1925591 RepID=A0A1L9QQ76_9CYAN|nr:MULTISPECIES: diadenylate cyclase CdaA [Roseofilum]MBP0030126.1 diadenylate cyclase CdaA [Roseofilum sp. Guam]MDB9520081.1 diadenylate cyclase CdaA [Roseofilum reptotaenium CS-1145]OJJ24841.1 TIGR00159 family protein [Roseofilum reptotaenium AO1-A]